MKEKNIKKLKKAIDKEILRWYFFAQIKGGGVSRRGKDYTMKMELRIEGKVIVIESEGAVSVQIRDENPKTLAPAVVPAAVSENALKNSPAIAPVVAPAPAVVSEIAKENAPAVVPVPAANDGLFAKLVQLRRELAMAANVPPYVIFNDKSLWDMVEKLPQDLAAFGNISGVGRAKLEKYGDVFLSAIKGVAA